MKAMLETSMYLIVMAFICLISIDYVTMNMSVSKVNETERYIEHNIELYGTSGPSKMLDGETLAKVREVTDQYGITFSYDYVDSTDGYDYYNIHLRYSLRSRMFGLTKTHVYDGLVRVTGT